MGRPQVLLAATEPPTMAEDGHDHVLVEDAIRAYLADCEGRKLREPTLRKYRTFTKQLRAFSEERGFVWLAHWRKVEVTDEFRLTWKDGARSGGKKLERMRSFFQFCVDRHWMKENPAAKLNPPVGASCG